MLVELSQRDGPASEVLLAVVEERREIRQKKLQFILGLHIR